jgi:hypothetical protein
MAVGGRQKKKRGEDEALVSLHTAYRLLLTACFPLPTAYWHLPTALASLRYLTASA